MKAESTQRARVVALHTRRRPKLRLVTRSPAFEPPRGRGVLISLDEKRVSREQPESPASDWVIVVAMAMLLSILIWRLVH